MFLSLPLLLNIIMLALSFYLSYAIQRGKMTYSTARNIQYVILILNVALICINIFYGNFLLAVLWGVVLASNMLNMGFFR